MPRVAFVPISFFLTAAAAINIRRSAISIAREAACRAVLTDSRILANLLSGSNSIRAAATYAIIITILLLLASLAIAYAAECGSVVPAIRRIAVRANAFSSTFVMNSKIVSKKIV